MVTNYRVSPTASRIPALESLRSVLLLLGVVVHAAMILPEFYVHASSSENFWMKFIYSSVHVWRVPTYMLISGFLSAALFSRGSIWDFIRGRFKRVTSVLLAAQLFIIPFFILSNGRCDLCAPYGGTSWLQVGWLHLWFLYDLVLISHLVVVLIWLKRKLPTATQVKIARAISGFKFGFLGLTVLAVLTTAIPGIFDSEKLLRINFGVVPDLPLIAYHGLFFSVGWIVWRNRRLESFQKHLWLYSITASALAILTYATELGNSPFGSLLANLTTWFAMAAVVGLFTKFLNRSKKTWTFLNDSAYWVYLWHALIILGFCWWFALLGLNIWVNLLVSSGLTLAITLVAYRYLVAPTIIGKYLSGRRRYSTRSTD